MERKNEGFCSEMEKNKAKNCGGGMERNERKIFCGGMERNEGKNVDGGMGGAKVKILVVG